MPEQHNIEYKISKENDRMGLSLEDLKVEHNSRPRNPKIAEACFLAGYIDTWGRGTLKIINTCKDAGLPVPEIKEMNGGLEVTIFNNQPPQNSERIRKEFGMIDVHDDVQKLDDNTGGAIGGIIGGTIDDLTDRQKEILALIIKNNRISIRTIAERLRINDSAAQEHVDKLKDKGVIERVGGTRGNWVVKRK